MTSPPRTLLLSTLALLLLLLAQVQLPALAQAESENKSESGNGNGDPTVPPNWHEVTAPQQRFLQGFITAFPQLSLTWTGTNYCAWDGVFCFYGNISVWLYDRQLIGRLPEWSEEDAKSANVAQIHLSGNPGISGTLPDSWKNLLYATSFDLNKTSVTGTIPNSWSTLPELVSANFASTKICGGMPNWANSKLEYFDIGNNGMKGRLSETFALMPKLEVVNIGGNDFCMCVPSSWGSVSALNESAASLPAVMKSRRCAVVNKCSKQAEACVPKKRDTVAGPLGSTLAVGALALSALYWAM